MGSAGPMPGIVSPFLEFTRLVLPPTRSSPSEFCRPRRGGSRQLPGGPGTRELSCEMRETANCEPVVRQVRERKKDEIKNWSVAGGRKPGNFI